MAPAWTDEEIDLVCDLAYHLHLQGKDREALIIFEGLLAIDPRNVYCLEALATLHLKMGDPEQAIKHASGALSFSPRRVEALACRCEAYLTQKRFGEADRDLDALKQLRAGPHAARLTIRRAAAGNFAINLLPDATSAKTER